MKKIYCILAAAAVLAACTKDAEVGDEIKITPTDDLSFIGTSTSTRTTMSTNANNGFDINWVIGDQIGIFAEDVNGAVASNATYLAQSAGTSSQFLKSSATDVINWGTGAHNFYAYYPRTTATDATVVPASVPAVQEQSAADNTDHLQPLAFLWAKNEGVNKPADNAITLQFQNVFSILELVLGSDIGDVNCSGVILRFSDPTEKASAVGAKVNVKTGAVDYSSATTSNEIKLNLTTPVTLTKSATKKFYMMITPGHEASRFSIYAVLADGSEVKLGSKGMPVAGLPAGVKATLTMGVPAFNLSEEYGASNCYIVNKPGTTYKFKANIKGNGVAPLGETTTITPTKARMLWSQIPISLDESNPGGWPLNDGNDNATMTSIIDKNSVELKTEGSDTYIYFTTAAAMTAGNVGICVTDASDNILWSWHLWCLEGYDPESHNKTIDLTKVASSSRVQCTMMDRNLGAYVNPGEVASPTHTDYAQAHGYYYEFGRKDPFQGPRSYNGYNSYISYTEADGTVKTTMRIGGSDVFKPVANNAIEGSTGITDNIAYTVAHPMNYISNGDGYVWTEITSPTEPGTTLDWGKLWGNQTGKVGTKTMYDPCPAGYRVPDPDNFRFVTSHDDNILSTYASTASWKLNCVETIYEADKTNVTTSFTGMPYGLHFYIHGTKTALQDGDSGYDAAAENNVGKAPSDPTTIYFPAQGFIGYSGTGWQATGGALNVVATTNAPSSTTFYGGNRYFMKACQNGDFFYTGTTIAWGEQMSTAQPVRCIKDNSSVSNNDKTSAVDLSDNGTANCYIVNAPNTTYKFKATVKGNGRTGDIFANRACTSTYTFVKGTPGADQTTVTIAPQSASLLWYMAWPTGEHGYVKTCPIEVKSVQLKDGYIYFRTPSTFINGNAVIAAYRGSEVVWSWHIWAAKDYDPIATQQKVGETATGYAMDRNVGAAIGVEDASNAWKAAAATGMYYQHGRKDPFTGPLDLNAGDGNRGGVGIGAMKADGSLMYGSNGSNGANVDGGYWYIQSSDYLVGIKQELGTNATAKFSTAADFSVKNPEKLIHNSKASNADPYDWWGVRSTSDPNFMYYWGLSAWRQFTNIATKSIYDPCPAGWIVPSTDFHYDIAKGTIAATTYGWTATLPSGAVVYFPRTGMRDRDNPSLSAVNTKSTYWLNAIGDAGAACDEISGTAISAIQIGSTCGCRPVRCVRENFR